MPFDPELNEIEEMAATWVVERDRGFAPGRQREFSCWLQADPRHAATFQALAETWNLMGEAGPLETGVGGTVTTVNFKSRRRLAWLPVSLAAAAAVAFAGVGWWQAGHALGIGKAARFALTASTEVGKLRKVELPDGSIIQLNTDSVVDVRFTPGERRVKLTRGEAHFSVAKNPERPFFVSAGGVDVRVVGTVFNVRLRPESVDVLVTEGKVRVAPPSAAPAAEEASGPLADSLPELIGGQKVSIARAPADTPRVVLPVDVSGAEIRHVLAWQARRLDFDATPMSEIVEEINRYNRHKLVVTDSRLNGQRFGGSFPANDFDTLVRMLEANFGVVAERKGEVTTLRLRKP